MSTAQNTSLFDDIPTAVSAGYGAMAYFAGYVIFLVLEGPGVSQRVNEGMAAQRFEQLGVDPPSTLQLVGWMFYIAHNAGLEITASAMGQSRSLSMNPGFVDKTYLLAIPPAILVATGYLLATREGSPGDSLPKLGASISVGYLILALVGAFAFRWSTTVTGGFGQEASLTMGPELIPGALIVGVVYPALFGGIGGYIAQETADQQGGPHRAGGMHAGQPLRQQGAQHQPGQSGQLPQDQQPRPTGEPPREDRAAGVQPRGNRPANEHLEDRPGGGPPEEDRPGGGLSEEDRPGGEHPEEDGSDGTWSESDRDG